MADESNMFSPGMVKLEDCSDSSDDSHDGSQDEWPPMPDIDQSRWRIGITSQAGAGVRPSSRKTDFSTADFGMTPSSHQLQSSATIAHPGNIPTTQAHLDLKAQMMQLLAGADKSGEPEDSDDELEPGEVPTGFESDVLGQQSNGWPTDLQSLAPTTKADTVSLDSDTEMENSKANEMASLEVNSEASTSVLFEPNSYEPRSDEDEMEPGEVSLPAVTNLQEESNSQKGKRMPQEYESQLLAKLSSSIGAKQFSHISANIDSEMFEILSEIAEAKQLAQDSDTAQAEGQLFRCIACGEAFQQETDLVEHKKMHKGERWIKCRMCDKRFTMQCYLDRHIRTHIALKPFYCELCGRGFITQGHLTLHMKTHRERTFQCTLCEKAYATAEHLATHVRTHPGYKRYQCTHCEKDFITPGHLATHIRTHTGEKPFPCEYCDKSFSQQANLRTHMRVHTGEKPFQCTICNKEFAKSNHLTVHMRAHTGDKPYKCTFCNNAFARPDNLSRHLKTHSTEKPHQCVVCDKSFKTQFVLNVHFKMHTGEKPYKCKLCDKGYTISSNLTAHMRSHTGEKPFECHLCHKRFAVSSSMKKHVMRHGRVRKKYTRRNPVVKEKEVVKLPDIEADHVTTIKEDISDTEDEECDVSDEFSGNFNPFSGVGSASEGTEYQTNSPQITLIRNSSTTEDSAAFDSKGSEESPQEAKCGREMSEDSPHNLRDSNDNPQVIRSAGNASINEDSQVGLEASEESCPVSSPTGDTDLVDSSVEPDADSQQVISTGKSMVEDFEAPDARGLEADSHRITSATDSLVGNSGVLDLSDFKAESHKLTCSDKSCLVEDCGDPRLRDLKANYQPVASTRNSSVEALDLSDPNSNSSMFSRVRKPYMVQDSRVFYPDFSTNSTAGPLAGDTALIESFRLHDSGNFRGSPLAPTTGHTSMVQDSRAIDSRAFTVNSEQMAIHGSPFMAEDSQVLDLRSSVVNTDRHSLGTFQRPERGNSRADALDMTPGRSIFPGHSQTINYFQ